MKAIKRMPTPNPRPFDQANLHRHPAYFTAPKSNSLQPEPHASSSLATGGINRSASSESVVLPQTSHHQPKNTNQQYPKPGNQVSPRNQQPNGALIHPGPKETSVESDYLFDDDGGKPYQSVRNKISPVIIIQMLILPKSTLKTMRMLMMLKRWRLALLLSLEIPSVALHLQFPSRLQLLPYQSRKSKFLPRQKLV